MYTLTRGCACRANVDILDDRLQGQCDRGVKEDISCQGQGHRTGLIRYMALLWKAVL